MQAVWWHANKYNFSKRFAHKSKNGGFWWNLTQNLVRMRTFSSRASREARSGSLWCAGIGFAVRTSSIPGQQLLIWLQKCQQEFCTSAQLILLNAPFIMYHKCNIIFIYCFKDRNYNRNLRDLLSESVSYFSINCTVLKLQVFKKIPKIYHN